MTSQDTKTVSGIEIAGSRHGICRGHCLVSSTAASATKPPTNRIPVVSGVAIHFNKDIGVFKIPKDYLRATAALKGHRSPDISEDLYPLKVS